MNELSEKLKDNFDIPVWVLLKVRELESKLAAQEMLLKRPSDPSVWYQVVDEALVVAHLGVANEDDIYEEAKRKLNLLIDWNIDLAEYMKGSTMSKLWINWRFGAWHFMIGPDRPYVTFYRNQYHVENKPDKWFEAY